jgi:2-polyprenyl-3-methyl-5-hydroxy-6-metoxy-1,4-benzoquinol methylase
MNLKDTYNHIASNWHNDHKNDDWWVEGVNKYISLFKKDDFILDVGCGAGVKAKYLSEYGLKILGIDFSDKLIEIAKREVPEANFLVHDFNDAESINHTFDGIFMQAVLLHVPKKEVNHVLQGLSKKLKKDGYIYISVKEKQVNGIEEEVVTENDYGYDYERFFSYFTLDELKRYLLNCGFELIFSDIIDSGKSKWIQVIGKKIKDA